MKKAKSVLLLFVTVLLMLGLSACKNADAGNDNFTGTSDDNVIYSPSVPATLVLGNGLAGNSANPIGTAYYKITGKDINLVSAASEPSAHEIIIGKTDRDISEKAYRALEFRRKEKTVGYAIYSDGKSVAIAFDEAVSGVDVAFNEAMEYFVSNYMDDETLVLKSGLVSYDIFYPLERQEERDLKNENFIWNRNISRITEILGCDKKTATEIIEQIKKLKNMYKLDYDIVQWLANLYDLETGGFYYSNSARNNTGYLPDLVSTDKAFEIIEVILGKGKMKISDFLEDEEVNKIVAFTKGLQNKNGEFYHPQWVDNSVALTSERTSADILAALNILNRFDARPTYDVGDVKGEGSVTPASGIVMPFAESTAKAVSFVLSANASGEIYIPPYLSSRKQFVSYLESLKIVSRTSNACNTIYADLPQYKAIDEYNKNNGGDYNLCNTVLEYMSSLQDGNGLWAAGVTNYSEVAEILDVVKLYNALGAGLVGFRETLITISDVAKFTDKVDNLEDIANVWSAFSAVVDNIKTYGTEDDKYYMNEAIADIYLNIREILGGTQNALAAFSASFHSFYHSALGDNSTYLGMPMALGSAVEGNVIATAVAVIDIYPMIFKALNLDVVPLFSDADRIVLYDTLSNLGVLIKTNDSGNFKYENFEEFDKGVLPYLYFQNTVSSSDTYYEIIDDKVVNAEEESQVLKWYAAIGKTFNQIVVPKRGESLIGANAAFFEADIKLDSIQNKEVRIRFDMRSSMDNNNVPYMFSLMLNPNGAPIKTSATDFKSTLDVCEGEWFKLRLEYSDSPYDYNYDGKNDIVYRAYINSNLVGEGYTPRYPDSPISATNVDNISLQIGTGYGACIYLDNVVLGQSKMIYDAPPPKDTDIVTYEPLYLSDKIATVLGSNSTAKLINMDVFGSVSRVLEFYSAKSSADELLVSPTLKNETANAITFETDIKIDPESDSATLYLEPRISSGAVPFRLILKATKDGDVTISSSDIPETVIGKSGEWINIKVEYMSPRIDYTGDGNDDLLYKIYINESEEAVATGYKPYTLGAYYTPLSIKTFALVFKKSSEARVYLDNTRLWQENLIPDPDPGFENGGDGTLNGADGDVTDNGGWT